MNIRLLYFARLREIFGIGQERLELVAPSATSTVRLADLLDTLRARGGVWTEELAEGRAYRVAINQDIVGPEQALNDNDEVALFPPVTGG
ncbi:MAG: molybdopterin synthase sulfur carrier subunit [Hydrogenophilales bacterium 28-61-23]|nr:MAG: molybdopterin synthase sulfur carrier subunit [Hydrogenophilales bacterium 28-61-23]